jgi:O-antigen biosynthesis protein
VSTAVQATPDVRRGHAPASTARVVADGKFLCVSPCLNAPSDGHPAGERFLVKGVTYGTFAPGVDGYQFPAPRQIAEDFRLMAELGINTVRVYTPPRRELLDEAAHHGLRVMVGLPWSQHVAFLDDRALRRAIEREIVGHVRALGDHPAVLMFALGNEIPAGVVRWHGRLRVERFLRRLYNEAKAAAPDALFTYVNFPPTEFLDLSFFDVCAFNVYLHREPELRAYLARLQNIAGYKPLLLAEAGADSIREGDAGQAAITAMHVRAAFEEGACGAVAFAWTDEWWRGGHPVEDWAFGLVDRQRKPKPAVAAVATVFADAPFSREAQATWPRISVVVCAYNAADSLEDNLESLERLTYPDYEIILVNDGSTDRTSEIGHAHPRVRVIDIPNGGLSAARNVGLAEATGTIVAYTDADTRVDRDWLTFLVQPFLHSDVVGSGGPNVVPDDDPPIAQCIARAPGGPTHVLLDDRIAEHVPGCNMAFRREALLAIGGFNPIYLRAGDDVDVCWRLQARNWKIGFSAAALVWHHHRSSVKSYWRQQVGYGEGERWLMAHHPEKFLDGRMLWHGRIYSPLPFVRSLWGERINAGVWGTAAFPSVYRRDVHPFAFLPHSIRWQLLSFVLALAGLVVAGLREHLWAAALLLSVGGIGIALTIAKDVSYALRSDVGSLRGSSLWYRLTVAYLHFLQPLARIRGQIRGVLSPPETKQPTVAPQTSRGPRPTLREARRALQLVSGGVTEDRYWSETWTTADRVLSELTDWLRRSRAVRIIEIDDGWSDDRDVSVLVGRWAWLDVRALVEEHADGKALLRVNTHLRPTSFGIVSACGLAAALLALAAASNRAAQAALAAQQPTDWLTTTVLRLAPTAGVVAAVLALAITGFAAWRTAQATATLRRGVEAVALRQGMVAMKAAGPARPPLAARSRLHSYGLRSAIVFVVMIVAIGASTLMLREAATTPRVVINSRRGGAGPSLAVWVDTPSGLALDPSGALYLADSHNDVIRRMDPGKGGTPAAGPLTVVAGSLALGNGFSGDKGPATRARLDTPDGVCIASDGDLVIADSHNDRIRRVDQPTHVITTIAGSGENGYDGDGKLATDAGLNTPEAVACAPDGTIYIADTSNNRVRVIDPKTGFIETLAGDGKAEGEGDEIGDGGPATSAHLNTPTDVAVAPNGDLYIADFYHYRVRKVDARTHVISTIAGDGTFGEYGDGGSATQTSLAGPKGVALASDNGRITVYIADYYNGLVRAVSPDGVIRNVSDTGVFGAPTRIAFEPKGGWLYTFDSSTDRVIAINIPKAAKPAVASVPRFAAPARKGG